MEVELLLFRETLEDKGVSKIDIDRKVDEERERLLSQQARNNASAEQPSTSNRQFSWLWYKHNRAESKCRDEMYINKAECKSRQQVGAKLFVCPAHSLLPREPSCLNRHSSS